jgi:hypothetical protein
MFLIGNSGELRSAGTNATRRRARKSLLLRDLVAGQ